MKYLNLLVFAALVAVSSYLFDEYFVAEKSASARASFEGRVTDDFITLKSDNILPAELLELNEVFLTDHRTNKLAVKWDWLARKLFPKAKDGGKYELQIAVFDDTNDPITVLQLSLFEVASKNKVWELSRTYASPAEPVSE
jgi:hypothetical protein